MKKMIALMICSTFVLSGALVPAKALSVDINENEQQLLDYVEQGMSINGEEIQFVKGSENYEALKTLLASEGIDLSAKDVETVKNSAKKIQDYVAQFPDDQEMTIQIMEKLITFAAPALAVFDVSAKYDSIKDQLMLVFKDGTTQVIMENAIKGNVDETIQKSSHGTKLERTGENFTSTYTIMGGLSMLLVGVGLMSLKKRELSE